MYVIKPFISPILFIFKNNFNYLANFYSKNTDQFGLIEIIGT